MKISTSSFLLILILFVSIFKNMTMDQPVGYMGQDYDAIVGELEGSGEKFVDEHEKEDLC